MHILPDKLNPCKQESGKLGGYIYDFIVLLNEKVVKVLTPAIQCGCCRNVNYWFLKYGLVILFASIVPFTPILGFLMVLAALAFRITETINTTQLRKKHTRIYENDLINTAISNNNLTEPNQTISNKQSKKSKKVSN
jgi:hypothetical protein